MNTTFNRLTKALVVFVIIDHILFFVLEAIFWMRPEVHNILLDLFNNPPASLGYPMHALVLRKLFINQGFYNFFLVCGAIAGLYLAHKNRNIIAGYALILLVCFAATGAGIVLAFTSKAYILAFLQAVPAAIAFIRIYPLFRIQSGKK